MRKKFLISFLILSLVFPFNLIFLAPAKAQETTTPDQDLEDVDEIFDEEWADSVFDQSEIEQNQSLIEFAETINKLSENCEEYASLFNAIDQRKIILSEEDIEAIREGKIDERLGQALVYLVRPVSEKGAGFQRIKVKRLIKNYSTQKRALSRESEYESEDQINVSAHHNGQAADIAEVDYIHFKKVTKHKAAGITYKRKTEDLPPVPIRIVWQSEQGKGEGIPGFYGNTANELFENLSISSIKEALGDIIDYNLDKLQGNDIPSWTKWLGVIMLFEDFDLPIEGFEEGADFKETLKNVGRATLAEKLKIDKEALKGDSREELLMNMGRAYLENKLDLAHGSLQGDSWEEIFKNAGKRKIEKQLKLPPRTLDTAIDKYKLIKNNSRWLAYGSNEAKDEAFDLPEGSAEEIEHNSDKGLMLIGAGTILYALAAKTENKKEIIDKIKKGQPLDVEIKTEQASVNVDVDIDTLKALGAKDKNKRNEAIKQQGSKTLDALALNPDLSLGLTKQDFEKIKKDQMKMNDLVLTVGIRKLENELNLPANALYYTARKNLLSADYGREIVENKLGLKKGSFKGTIEDVIFANPDKVQDLANSYSCDAALNLEAGTTDKLLTQQMSVDSYASLVAAKDNSTDFLSDIGRATLEERGEKTSGIPKEELSRVGRETINKKVASEINKRFKLTERYQKYAVTEDDIVALLNGNWQTVASKVASRTIDKALSFPANGTMDMLTGKKSPEQVFKEAGAIRFGKLLGLQEPVSLEGNLKANYGQKIIEERLGLEPGSFDYKRYNHDVHALLWGVLFSQDKTHLFYEKNKDTDAVLGIPAGSTEKLTGQVISVEDYCNLVANQGIANITLEKLADTWGLEDKYNISGEEFTAAVKTLLNWKKSTPEQQDAVFETLAKASGRSWDNKFKFDPDSSKTIFTTPEKDLPHQPSSRSSRERSVNLLLQQGMRKLNFKVFGIEQNVIELRYREGKGLDFEINGVALSNWALPKIKNITAIPVDDDALRFLRGDISGGFVCWSVAQITKETNEIFDKKGLPHAKFTYEEAKAVYFGNPAEEQKVIDEAWNQFVADHPEAASQTFIKESVQDEARAFYRQEAKKNLQYKVMDGYLIDKVDDKIPVGFSKVMFEGSWEERTAMIASYEVNRATKGWVKMSEKDAKLFLEGKYGEMSDEFYTSLGEFWNKNDILGFDLTKPGETVKAFFKIAQEVKTTGRLDVKHSEGLNMLKNIYTDWGIQRACQYFDKQLKVPVGTAYQIYKAYDNYIKAYKAYQVAKTNWQIAGAYPFIGSLYTQEFQKASNNLASARKAGIDLVVQLVGSKTFDKIDQQLRLPPGTTSGLATLLVTGNPIGLIFSFAMKYIFTTEVNIYGETPICQPRLNSSTSSSNSSKESILKNLAGGGLAKIFAKRSAPQGFEKLSGDPDKDFPFYQRHAQCAVERLIGALLEISEVTGNKDLLPTQILTLRQEDVEFFADQIYDLYGDTSAQRGRSGVLYSDKFAEYVHIGY